MIYLAKSQTDKNKEPQKLETHLIAVALKSLYNAHLVTSSEQKNDRDQSIIKNIRTAALFAGALHDIGKVCPDFQKMLKKTSFDEDDESPNYSKKKSKFNGPYHHELSYAIIQSLYKPMISGNPAISSRFAKDDDIVTRSVYWHHPCDFEFKKNGRGIRRKNVIQMLEYKGGARSRLHALIDASTPLLSSVSRVILEKTGMDLSERINKNPVPLDSTGEIGTPLFTPSQTLFDSEDGLLLKVVEAEANFKLVLACLINADVEISKMCEQEAKSFIDNFSLPEVEEKVPAKNSKKLSDRDREQKKLADSMLPGKLSICGVDTGAGKTSIALYAKQTDKMSVCLPKIFQVDALKGTIEKDYKRIYGDSKDLAVSAVHSGSNDNEEDAEIKIYVFDRVFSGIFDRRDTESLFSSLVNDLVIDEFHEIATIPRMVHALAVMIKMRRYVNSKTILLSGTPDLALLDVVLGEDWENSERFMYKKRSELPNWKNEGGEGLDSFKVFIHKNSKEIKNNIPNDSIISFNRVRDAQELAIKRDFRKGDILCHSKFTKEDSLASVNLALELLSGPGKPENTAITAKMLSSSYDLNVSQIRSQISIPSFDSQMLGRLNRKKNKNGEYHLYKDAKCPMWLNGHGEVMELWNEHLDNTCSDGKVFTHRSFLTEVYDGFFENEEYRRASVDAIVSIIQKDENIKHLSDWFPKKGLSRKRSGKKSSVVKAGFSGVGFRGSSYPLSAMRVDRFMNPIGQISGDEGLSITQHYLIDKITLASTEILKKACGIPDPYVGSSSDTPYFNSFFSERLVDKLEAIKEQGDLFEDGDAETMLYKLEFIRKFEYNKMFDWIDDGPGSGEISVYVNGIGLIRIMDINRCLMPPGENDE